MISLDKLHGVLRQEYPGASDEQIEQAAREVLKRLQEEISEIDGEEIAREIADATPLQDMKRFEEADMYGVMILSQRDEHACLSCLKHDGEQYTIKERRENPPLPHDGCENEECRCTMLAIPDRETYLDSLGEKPDLSNLPQFSDD
jgi:hypothetical protein